MGNPSPSTTTCRMPTVYLPHGGGPCFFMDPPAHAPHAWDRMAAFLRDLPAIVGTRPRALLIVSAHWEAPVPTVNSGAHPGMLYDYHGFPEHTYRLSWPAPGAPELAVRVRSLLTGAGIESAEDTVRGYDHGVFVPMLVAWPEADVPTLQLSLQSGLDPAAHLAIGRALAPLRDEGVLILGSGMSYHDLRGFFRADPTDALAADAFDAALARAMTASPPDRDRALATWESLPGARRCHPREEHLLPLMVAAGAAGADRGRHVFHDRVFGKAISGFVFGGAADQPAAAC